MCVRPDEDLKFIAMSGGKWNRRYGERTGLIVQPAASARGTLRLKKDSATATMARPREQRNRLLKRTDGQLGSRALGRTSFEDG